MRLKENMLFILISVTCIVICASGIYGTIFGYETGTMSHFAFSVMISLSKLAIIVRMRACLNDAHMKSLIISAEVLICA